jgi:hypothetical protein
MAGRTQPGDHKIDHLIKRRGGLIGKFSNELRMDVPGRDVIADHLGRYASQTVVCFWQTSQFSSTATATISCIFESPA